MSSTYWRGIPVDRLPSRIWRAQYAHITAGRDIERERIAQLRADVAPSTDATPDASGEGIGEGIGEGSMGADRDAARQCVIWGCAETGRDICGCCGHYVCMRHLARERRCIRCVNHP